MGEKEGNVDYGGMVQPSQQHVARCVKGVEWGLGTRGLRILAAFWAGIPVEVTQEAGVGGHSRCRRVAIGISFYLPHTAYGILYPLTWGIVPSINYAFREEIYPHPLRPWVPPEGLR